MFICICAHIKIEQGLHCVNDAWSFFVSDWLSNRTNILTFLVIVIIHHFVFVKARLFLSIWLIRYLLILSSTKVLIMKWISFGLTKNIRLYKSFWVHHRFNIILIYIIILWWDAIIWLMSSLVQRRLSFNTFAFFAVLLIKSDVLRRYLQWIPYRIILVTLS